jgi:PIN domain nuclease of toxin-antitoxin system
VNLLLDSHTFLWFVDADARLSSAAQNLRVDASNRKFVSIASCWEITIKVSLGKLTLGEPATTFLPRELAANHFELLAIDLRHATFVETLPRHHRDPFDRLLIAQALVESIPIVSVDATFDAYGVQRLW